MLNAISVKNSENLFKLDREDWRIPGLWVKRERGGK
jgi:hypothetical protein